MPTIAKIKIIPALLAVLLAACSATPAVSMPVANTISTPPPLTSANAAQALVSGRLVVYSGRSEPLLKPVLDAFQSAHPHVEILLKAGSNSELANALLEERANPQADVFITTEIFTAQSLASQGVFSPYRPAGVDLIPSEFRSPDDSWVGLTRRLRVIMYNTELVSAAEAPQSIFDLVDPKWRGQVAAAGSTNGSMQAQIAVLRSLIGEKETESWLNGLLQNQVVFFGGHTDVRKAVGAGEFKLGLVNHYYYYLQLAEGSPVGVVFPDQGEGQIGLISNATAAALVKGGANPGAAQALLDFLLSPQGQGLFAEQNYEYPLLPGVALRPGVQPLDGLRFANANLNQAALNFQATFDLMERVGLP